ncbi:hypothetical protein RBB50_008161 [Rhinocladiella similis]
MMKFCLHAILGMLIVFLDHVNAQCNPLNGQCPAIPGLPTSTYSIDFTQQTGLPSDWIQAEGAPVTFGKNGANFTVGKRFDAPYIWTRFYVLFGRIETVVKIAPGTGIVTSAVMMSDDLDEVDWEWSGNNFAQSSGRVQTNWFGKGVPGSYDRGSQPQIDNPQGQYHTYVFDWTPDTLTWSVDGSNVYTTKNSYQTSGAYQYPQTPSRLHLGVWAAGDQDNNPATVWWAGGYSNFSLAPFSAYVKSVKITTSNPCSSWQYPNPFNGTYQAVLCTNQTMTLPCTYTVKPGDNGQTIASSLEVTLEALKGANPGLNWDLLVAGQSLNVPGATCATSTTTSSTTTQLTSLSSSSSQTVSTISTTTSYVDSSSTVSSVDMASSTTPSTGLTSESPSSTSATIDTSSAVQTEAASSSSGMTSSLSSTSVPDPSSSSNTFATISTTAPPQSPSSSAYTVVAGDYGWAIASKLGCGFDALLAANPNVDWDQLQVGQILNAPCSTGGTQPTGSSSATGTGATASDSGNSSSASASASATGSNSDSATSTSSASQPNMPVSSASATNRAASSSALPSQSGSNDPASVTNDSSTSSGTWSASYPSSTVVSSAITQAASTSAAIWSSPQSAGSTGGITSSSSASPTTPDRTTTTAVASPSNQQVTSTNPPSQNIVKPANPSSATKMVCNQDNCLRNMIDKRYSSLMMSFCPGYTGITSNPAPLPTFLTGCSTNVNRVSSACSCLMTSYASAHSSSSTPAMTVGAQKAGTPSWRLKRSPLRWERLIA